MNYGKLKDVLLDYIVMLSDGEVSDNRTTSKLDVARELLQDTEDVLYEQLHSASN